MARPFPFGRTSVLIIAFFVLTVPALAIPGLPALAQSGDQTGTVTLSGQLTDQSTGQAVQGAAVTVENRWAGEKPQPTDGQSSPTYEERGHETHEVTTDANGSYAVELQPGWVNLRVDHPGFSIFHASGQLKEDAVLAVPLRPAKDDGATLTGTVRDAETGEPVAEAWVAAGRDYEPRCDGDVCYAEATEDPQAIRVDESGGSDGSQEAGGSFNIWYEPRYQDWASTHTTADGTYHLTVAAGKIVVSASARDHLHTERKLEVAAGEQRTLDLQLRPIPPDTVRVTGTVVDAESGEPIRYAQVNVNNQQWGHWNSTQTDEQGRYELRTKPGYTLLNVEAPRNYWVPCEADRPTGTTEDAEAVSSSDERMAIAPGKPYPYCEPQQRAHGYLPRVNTFIGSEDSSLTYDARLKRAPSPDASFRGWVVNTTSQQGIADAWISFYNEETNEWGQARTDADGSYTIDVRAGYYTVRAQADGHFQNALNVEVAAGEDRQLTVELQPGRTQYGFCCYIMERGAATDKATAGDGDAAAGPEGAAGEDGGEQGAQDGFAFQGGAGELGPYPGKQSESGDGPATETPLVGLAALLALVSLAAGALRLRHRR